MRKRFKPIVRLIIATGLTASLFQATSCQMGPNSAAIDQGVASAMQAGFGPPAVSPGGMSAIGWTP